MEWYHTVSPKNLKARTIPLAGKNIGTVFWDAKGCILVNLLPRNKTIKAVHYLQML
jgi:hypothetical protein